MNEFNTVCIYTIEGEHNFYTFEITGHKSILLDVQSDVIEYLKFPIDGGLWLIKKSSISAILFKYVE